MSKIDFVNTLHRLKECETLLKTGEVDYYNIKYEIIHPEYGTYIYAYSLWALEIVENGIDFSFGNVGASYPYIKNIFIDSETLQNMNIISLESFKTTIVHKKIV